MKVGIDDPLPEGFPGDPDEFADRMSVRYDNWPYEIALFKRCGGAVGESLTGEANPLTLLFGSGEPTAGEMYINSPMPTRGQHHDGRHRCGDCGWPAGRSEASSAGGGSRRGVFDEILPS